MASTPRIGGELAAFLRSGLAITVATRDGDLQPDGAWAWAAHVPPDGAHLTVFLYEEAAEAMLRNLREHPEIAVVFDRPTTHRACQVKGRCVGSRGARDDERAEVERQVGAFRADLEAIGIAPSLTAGWRTWPATALLLRVEQVFEQTPGPGTGEAMP